MTIFDRTIDCKITGCKQSFSSYKKMRAHIDKEHRI